MPLLENDPDLLAGFQASSPLIPMPLRGSVWSQAPNIGKAAKEAFVEGNYRAFVNVGQHALAQLGYSVGVPDWAAAGFETFFKLAEKPIEPSQIAKGVVSGTVELVQGALQQASTAVPIVGLIIQLGLYLWDIIDTALKFTDTAERPPDQAIVYELAGDLEAANDIKSRVGHKDWTTLFMPPAEDGWRLSEIAWTPGGGTEGFKFDIPNISHTGLFPGVAERLGTYQFPLHDIGSTRPWNFATGFMLSTTGELLPSGRSFSALLWQSVMKPSVAMFQVDSHAMESAWEAYFESLWDFSQSDWNYGAQTRETITGAIQRACTYCKIDFTQAKPYWHLVRQSLLQEFSIPKLESKLDHLTLRYTDIVRYCGIIHRERARAALRTLVCAYVPPNAPLLQADPGLKAYHAQMRTRLLTHPARYDVELDLIPDAAYRKAVDDSTILNPQVGGGLIGTKITTGGPSGIDGGNDDDGPKPPGPQAPQGVVVSTPPVVVREFDIRHAAGIATTGLLAAGAAWYFRDDLRRVVLGVSRIARR